MKLTTLCYIEQDDKYLMLYRNKKNDDENEGKWIGVGGKFEAGESPYECVKREVLEETGLTLTNVKLRGLIDFKSDIYEEEMMYLFTSTEFKGKVNFNCNEGTLKWIPTKDILFLPLWDGDRIFIRKLINGEDNILLTLSYEGDRLVSHDKYCTICPKKCGANRNEGIKGACKSDASIGVAKAYLHMWEEPCISSNEGSGTVFFTGCNLSCVFCQNEKISHGKVGIKITEEQLVDIFLKLQADGANNINLVTPTHYATQIAMALIDAKKRGLKIPIVYNTSGYESVETLKLFQGLVDIYMPDFKYMSKTLSKKYSFAADYADVAKLALDEMVKQVGEPKVNKSGIMKKGVIVRHLLLPDALDDSKAVLKYLYETYGNKIIISIMSQYTPLESTSSFKKFPELFRRISDSEYEELINYAVDIGIENAFIQEGETATESFIPDFEDFNLEEFLHN